MISCRPLRCAYRARVLSAKTKPPALVLPGGLSVADCHTARPSRGRALLGHNPGLRASLRLEGWLPWECPLGESSLTRSNPVGAAPAVFGGAGYESKATR